jgi:hypothetical protein
MGVDADIEVGLDRIGIKQELAVERRAGSVDIDYCGSLGRGRGGEERGVEDGTGGQSEAGHDRHVGERYVSMCSFNAIVIECIGDEDDVCTHILCCERPARTVVRDDDLKSSSREQLRYHSAFSLCEAGMVDADTHNEKLSESLADEL